MRNAGQPEQQKAGCTEHLQGAARQVVAEARDQPSELRLATSGGVASRHGKNVLATTVAK